MFGGLPGAGATMRTVVNVNAGGRTPISGALHAVILLAIVLGAGALAQDIPKAVLAGILIKVGTDIIDWDYLKRLKSAPKAGVIMMFTVLFVTVFIDLITAVSIGMVMASFVFMQRMVDLQLDSITAITEAKQEFPMSNEEEKVFKEANEYEKPLNVYGYSKFLFDQYVRRLLPEAKSQIVGMRYFNVYGPREFHKGSMASVALHNHNQKSCLLREKRQPYDHAE